MLCIVHIFLYCVHSQLLQLSLNCRILFIVTVAIPVLCKLSFSKTIECFVYVYCPSFPLSNSAYKWIVLLLTNAEGIHLQFFQKENWPSILSLSMCLQNFLGYYIIVLKWMTLLNYIHNIDAWSVWVRSKSSCIAIDKDYY